MAITKSTILTEATTRTNRTSVTDIDDELKAVMIEVSTKWGFLEKTGTVTIAAASNNITMPTDYRKIRSVTVAGKILSERSIEEINAFAGVETAASQPIYYSVLNDTLYVHPNPSDSVSTVATLYYSYIARDVDSIPFPDDFLEILIQGVCFKIYEEIGGAAELPAASGHLQAYNALIEEMKLRYPDRA